jgi:hypothetical protein
MSTPFSTKTRRRVADAGRRSLLDTSVIIDMESIDSDLLPEQMLTTALSLAELPRRPSRHE